MTSTFDENDFSVMNENPIDPIDMDDEIKALEDNKVEDPFNLDMAIKSDNEDLKEEIPDITEDDILTSEDNTNKKTIRRRKKKNIEVPEESNTSKNDEIPEIPNIEEIIESIFGKTGGELDIGDKEFDELEQQGVNFISEAKQAIKKILSIVKNYEKSRAQSIYEEDEEDLPIKRQSRKRKREEQKTERQIEEERDELASKIVDRMNIACEIDRENNKERRMAVNKLEILPEVMPNLSDITLKDKLIQHGVLSVIRKWLEPLPDKTIPNIKIRESMLKILENMNALSEFVIKQSGIGRIVMFIAKTDPERNIASLAKSIIDKWSKHIFEINDTYFVTDNFYQQKRPQRSATSSKLKEKKSFRNIKDTEPQNKQKSFKAQIPDKTSVDFVYHPESRVNDMKKTKKSPVSLFLKKQRR